MSQRQLLYQPALPRMRFSAPIQPGITHPARVDPAPSIVRSSAVDPGAYMRLTRTGTATQSTASTTVAASSPVIRVPITPAPAAYSSANGPTRSPPSEVIYVSSSPAPEIKDEMPTSETMPELAATESTHELAALGFYASSSPAPDSTITSKMMHDLPALASNAATACTPSAVPRKFNPASTAYAELSDSDDEPMIVDSVMVDVKPSLDKVATAHDPPPASAPAHSASVVSASIDSAPMPASSPAAITVKKRGRPRKTDPPAPLQQQQKKKKAPARVPVADKGKGKAPAVDEAPTGGAPAPAVPQAKKARATRQRPDASDIAAKTIALSYAVNRLEHLDEERKEGRQALADANKEILRLTVSVERYRKLCSTFGLTDSTCSDLATYPQSQAYNTGFNGLAPAPAMGDQFGAGWGSGPTGASAWSGVAGGSNMAGGTGGEGPSGAGAWSGVAGGSNMAGDVQMAYGSTHNAYNT
ncbi:hypothetical protein EV121DRAFT_256247 [Schizophyllum commune]